MYDIPSTIKKSAMTLTIFKKKINAVMKNIIKNIIPNPELFLLISWIDKANKKPAKPPNTKSQTNAHTIEKQLSLTIELNSMHDIHLFSLTELNPMLPLQI